MKKIFAAYSDWVCSRCGGPLCTACGYCPKCEYQKHYELCWKKKPDK